MRLAFVSFRAASDETELPTPNHPVVHDPKLTLRYSAICTPDPPKSAGKSFIFGRPSFIGRTVSA